METLDKHFREITKAAFARHGFAHAELAGRWAEVVGEEIAAGSAPARIAWRRRPAGDGRRTGGRLIVRAAPGRALDLQHQAPAIMARINGYFGYAAIADVLVVQAGSWNAPRPFHIAKPPPTVPDFAIADLGLRAALVRLAAAVVVSRDAQEGDQPMVSTPNIE
jgi:hypothetical protein